MSSPATISKNAVLPPEQDFEFLRSEGLKYIESLASDLWTDYNEHDPGITILEVLCYALTELGYRTAFNISDIIAGQDGTIPADQCFYTAKSILTVNPLTVRDYRKLLIDLEEIQNAWLFYQYNDVGQEVPFYADCGKDALVIDNGTQPVQEDHRIKLSGLYKVLLDLKNSPEYGDLNSTNVSVRIPESDIQDQVITVAFFNLVTPDLKDDLSLIVSALVKDGFEAAIQSVTINRLKYHWEGLITVVYTKASVSKTAVINLIIRIDSLFRKDEVEQATTALKDLFTVYFIHELFVAYQKKTSLINETLLKAKSTLLAHRNLCEDFLSLSTVCVEEVAVCADIDVTPDADIEMIQATIFDQVQEYFSPSIHFYSLKELMQQGVAVENIFEGPVLQHGFINNDELDKDQLRQVIRTSDLINIIMGINGVLAVKNLIITKYDAFGEPILPSEKWCMAITPGCKPLLNTSRTKLIFYKGKLPLKAKIAETLDTLSYLQAIREKNKLYGFEDDLPVPTGNYQDLSDYYSIQNDLPQTYGAGIAGLPQTVSDQRKAQAKQLKAYLMFFDQLLADYFTQLKGAGRLLSVDADIKQSYFTQFLYEAQPPFYQDGVKDANALYTDPVMIEQLLSGQKVGTSDWQNLIETENTFYNRRNTFLDHLLARFAESFSDYVLMMYQVHFDLQESDDVNSVNVIEAKIKFLQNYPDISANRGRAFNYCPVKVNPVTKKASVDQQILWSADNISELEKRSALLAGIDLPTQERLKYFLFCHSMADIIETETSGIKTYSFSFFNEKNEVVLSSVKTDYTSSTAAAADASFVTQYLGHGKNYYAQKQPDSTYQVFLRGDLGTQKNVLIATNGKLYATLSLANEHKAALALYFRETCEQEGLYLVEHILLRPRVIAASNFDLMEVCLNKDCHFCGEQDPYTFRASVVLPYWPERFKNITFRKYFESIIQTEAPAHIALKICWINSPSMRNFEIAYRSWVNALAGYSLDQTSVSKVKTLRDTNNALIKILQNLHSEYPLATLHDCEESANTNVVILGSTTLGTY